MRTNQEKSANKLLNLSKILAVYIGVKAITFL